MKKYLVVAWNGYYPDCELYNIRFQTDDREEAYKVSNFFNSTRRFDHSRVVDRDEYEPEQDLAMEDYYIHLAEQDGWYNTNYSKYTKYEGGTQQVTRQELIKLYQ